MPIAQKLPQLRLEDIEELETPIALFACGEASESMQIAADSIVISVILRPRP